MRIRTHTLYAEMMEDTYRTIEGPARGTFKDKGSRFLAFAFPVIAEEGIKTQLEDLRKQYHDARHHCFAWRLGAELDRFRSNDDGEPAGSAGSPILGQIRSKQLTDVLVVVVRYFGGTLLGVGGLINAYRSAAAGALDSARIVERKVLRKWKLNFGYSGMNQVMKIIKEHDLTMEDQQFDLECSATIHLWIKTEERVVSNFRRIEGCVIELLE
jgi:uncharacterized YigZ family protein